MQTAETFAQAWIAAWNARDLDAILAHYAPDIVFLSPFAEKLLGTGRVVGIDALRSYWRAGLDATPTLHFELRSVLTGYRCLTILYRNHRDQQVAETVEFDAAGKVIRSFACYDPALTGREHAPHRFVLGKTGRWVENPGACSYGRL